MTLSYFRTDKPSPIGQKEPKERAASADTGGKISNALPPSIAMAARISSSQTEAGFDTYDIPPALHWILNQRLRPRAKRTEGSQLALVGVWRLNKEPDGSHLYIALQSNGSAISTINGGTEGKWRANERGALCEWPDGWVDQIERGTAGWQKRSWIGSDSSAPADLSLATRVGETRFSVEP